MLGVALAGREIFVGERAIAHNEDRFEKLETAYLDCAANEDGLVPSQEAFSRLANSLRECRQSRLDRIGRFVNAEMSVVCAGTLIWGFGDIAL